jgi:hypothetical protein
VRRSHEATAALVRFTALAMAYPRAGHAVDEQLEVVLGRPVLPLPGQSYVDATRLAWREAMSEAVTSAMTAGLTKTLLRGHRGRVPKGVLDGFIREPRGDPAELILKHWPVVVAYEVFMRDLERQREAGHGITAARLEAAAAPVFRAWAEATALSPPHNSRHRQAPDLRADYDRHFAAARARVVARVNGGLSAGPHEDR